MTKAFKFLKAIAISLTVYAAISHISAPVTAAREPNINEREIKQGIPEKIENKSEKFKMNPFRYEQNQKKELTDSKTEGIHKKMSRNIKATLDYFVSKGKITQTDADTVIGMISDKTKKTHFSDFPQSVKDAFKEMEAAYTALTEKQKTVINETIKNKFGEAMKKLVDEKKITEKELKDIEKHQRNWDINLNLSDDQESLIFEMARSARDSALVELVKTNIITSEQAEILKLCGFKFKQTSKCKFKFGGTDDRGRMKFGNAKEKTEPKFRGKNITRSSFA